MKIFIYKYNIGKTIKINYYKEPSYENIHWQITGILSLVNFHIEKLDIIKV